VKALVRGALEFLQPTLDWRDRRRFLPPKPIRGMDAEEGSPQGWVYGVFWRQEAATGYEQNPHGAQREGQVRLVVIPRDDERLIIEVQPAVFVQHFLGGFQVSAVADHFFQALVLDLVDVDRRVPRRKQR